MSDASDLRAEARTTTGTSSARRMRRLEERVPGIIYGAESEPTKISLPQNELIHALDDEGFYSRILTIDVDGKPTKVVLKALQRHPWKATRITHIDFFRVSAKEKLNMNIPLHFIGEDECPGVKAGGIVLRHFNELEIRCLPADLPEFIEVDISKMDMDDVLHLTDLKVPANLEIVALSHGDDEEHNQGVVAIHEPRIEVEPVEEVAEAEGEEGEEKSAESSEEGKAEDENK